LSELIQPRGPMPRRVAQFDGEVGCAWIFASCGGDGRSHIVRLISAKRVLDLEQDVHSSLFRKLGDFLECEGMQLVYGHGVNHNSGKRSIRINGNSSHVVSYERALYIPNWNRQRQHPAN